jgi:hypothetical protein
MRIETGGAAIHAYPQAGHSMALSAPPPARATGAAQR